MTTMTANQGETLANLIHQLRPEWGLAGVAKALYEAREMADAMTLTRAALAAAADPGNRTPAIIGLHGPHWLGLEHKTPKVDTGALCDICSRPQPVCEQIARRTGDDHRFIARADALALVTSTRGNGSQEGTA